jgi:flagellin
VSRQSTRYLVAASSLVLAAALGQPVAAQTIVNGGFESQSFAGWTAGGDSLFSGVTCPGPGATVYQGSCSAFLGTIDAAGSLSQTFATIVGQSYLVSFAVQYDGGTPGAFNATFGNASLYSVTNPVATTGFLVQNLMATATATSTTLSFGFRDDPGFIYLDGVSVAAVPEPGTFGLFAMGAIALAARRRFGRQGR